MIDDDYCLLPSAYCLSSGEGAAMSTSHLTMLSPGMSTMSSHLRLRAPSDSVATTAVDDVHIHIPNESRSEEREGGGAREGEVKRSRDGRERQWIHHRTMEQSML